MSWRKKQLQDVIGAAVVKNRFGSKSLQNRGKIGLGVKEGKAQILPITVESCVKAGWRSAQLRSNLKKIHDGGTGGRRRNSKRINRDGQDAQDKNAFA